MRKKKLTWGHSIIILMLVIMATVCIYPLWYTLICSFSDRAYIDAGMVWWIPRGFNLSSYKTILEDSFFLSSFLVSVKRVVVGCTVNFLFLVVTAYPFSMPQKRFPAAKYLKWFFMANMLFSGGMIPSYVLMREYNLFNSFWVMILPGALPVWNMILLINFFRNVPYELNESALMDGANPFQILFKIYVPLSKASLACLTLFQFVGHWNAYFDGLIYINDQKEQPLQTYIYQMSVNMDLSTLSTEQIIEVLKTSSMTVQSAKVFVALIPILCVYPFIQRYFTTGMNLGAVKG